MCDPVSIFMGGMALYQGYQQNREAKAQAKYQEQVAEANRAEAKNEAIRLANKGVREENDLRRASAEMLSRQRAQFGANGVQVDSGSALQVQEDTVNLGEYDALTHRENMRDQVSAMERQANSNYSLQMAEASQTRAAGKNALTAGIIGAGTAAVNSKWFTSKSAGWFGSGGGAAVGNGGGHSFNGALSGSFK